MSTKDFDHYLKVAAGLAGAYGVFHFLIQPKFSIWENEKKQKQKEESAKKYTYRLKNLKTGKIFTVNLETEAAVINDALHGNPLIEDEARAIASIGKVPSTNPNLVLVLATLYENNFGHNLKNDFIKYLSPVQWKQVAFKFANM